MPSSSTNRDVAIIGYSCKFAGADDIEEFWQNLRDGRSSFGPVPPERWNNETFFAEHPREPDKTYVTRGGFMNGIDLFAAMHFGIAPRRVEAMDPQHRLVLDAVRVAMQDAGLEKGGFDASRVGTFLGVSTCEYRNLSSARTNAMLMADGAFGGTDQTTAHAIGHGVENVTPVTAFSIPGLLMNMAAANVAHQWKLGGPAFTVDAACASSLVAVSDAMQYIRSGVCDMAIAGGVYLNLTPENIVGFSRIGAVSRKGACRPFDAEGDGFLQGDGVGMVVLKRLDQALADGDRIHAVLKGIGVNNDGDSSGPMAPSVSGQVDVMRRAYADAEVDPKSVGFVECHGTATAVGDPVEVEALHEVFAGTKSPVQISSVKANIGHTMSAAGVAGLIHAILCVERQEFTPLPGFETPNPALKLDERGFVVSTESAKWESETPRRAGISSFGFGGTNCHAVIEEAPKVESASTDQSQYLVLSAPNRTLLAAHAMAIAKTIVAQKLSLDDVATTLNTARNLESVRLAIVASSASDLVEKLRETAPRIAGASTLVLGPDVFLAEGPAPGIAFMFPGQGAQRVGLLKDLYDRYPAFKNHLDAIASQVDDQLEKPLLDYLYAEATEDAEAALRATEICQPAMAALGLALDRFFADLGIRPDVTLGHSLGEFVAAASGGLISHEDALKFVTQRGRLMATLPIADFGAMAAVMASETDTRFQLTGRLCVANINHPTQTVVAGPTDEIVAFVDTCVAQGIKATRLNVSHAFHSPVVASIAKELQYHINAISFSEPSAHIASAITGKNYDVATAPVTFADHATTTVNFVQALKTASEHAAYFVELGAGTTLTSFANGTLSGHVGARNAAAKDPDGGREFQRTLAVLAALGVPLKTRSIQNGRLVSLPATPLETQRYWVVRDKKTPLAITPKSSPMFTPVPDENTMAQPSESLIELFRQQNEILQQHANLLAKQMEALGFPVETARATPVAMPAPAPLAVSQPAPQASAVVEDSMVQESVDPKAQQNPDYSSIVFGAIAAVSAFPREALKPAQVLSADLGFDSLLFVDLGSQLTAALPGLVIPADAFNQNTSIADVVAFLESAQQVVAPSAAAEAAPAPFVPLSRYEVALSDAPLPAQNLRHEWNQGVVAISTDNAGVAIRLAQRLAANGVPVALFGTMRAATKLLSFAGGTRAEALKELLKHHRDPKAIVYLVEGSDEIEITTELHQIAQTLAGHPPQIFITSVDTTPAQAAAIGFTKALSHEWTDTRFTALTLDTENDAEAIEAELFTPIHDLEVRVGESRQIPVLVHTGIEQPVADWRNQIVLVTGGSRGIGKMIAEKLVELGARVVTTGRTGKASATDSMAFVPWDCTTSADEKTRKKLAIFGQFTALIHSAGIIRDGLAATKSAADIQNVVAVKTHGLQNALDVASEAKRVASFSSWAGRFGNRGQADYSAANEAMRAMTSRLRAQGIEAITFDWPAWDGTDMVASIPAAVRAAMEAGGVTFMTPTEGLDAFFAEWGMGAEEVVFGRNLPEIRRTYSAEFEASLSTLPWAADHKLKNRAVLPFAFALDLALQAATTLGEAATISIDEFELCRGVEVDEKTRLQVLAHRTDNEVNIEIFSKVNDQKFLAYKGRTNLLSDDISTFESQDSDTLETSLGLQDFYKIESFHGPRMQAIKAIEHIGAKYSSGVLKNHRLESPLGESLANPYVVDGAMQLVLYWLKSQHGAAAYPSSMKRYVQVAPFTDEVRCTLMLQEMEGDEVLGSIRFNSMDGQLLAVMHDVTARIFERSADKTAPEAVQNTTVDESLWKIDKFPEVEALKQRLEMAFLVGVRNPYFHWHDGVAKNRANIEGKEMMNFSSYNYLGYSGHPEVTKAAQDAITHYGTSVSASRVASGEIPLHRELEKEISEFIGVDAALVFSAGHHANESVIGHLFGEGDLILHDALAHNSIMTGAEMSGAKRMPFPHNDWQALDRILTQLRGSYKKVGIMIEGVYSMDGDIPELAKFLDVKDKHRALLYVDEAHSIGCIGPRGAGISDYFGIDARRVDIWMGTLSKSFASCGGYIAGSASLIEYLKYTVPGFVFSAGISPANSAAALKSCQLMKSEPEVIHRLQARAKYFLEKCQSLGIDTGPSKDSAVVPCIVGNSFHCLQLSERLADRGINVQPIVYPAVEDDASRLRFFLSSTHSEEELDLTANIVAEELALVRAGAAAE
jgi:8-amino-7-oxononanoate synthase